MARQRKIHDSGFKARAALEALKEREMVGQLAKRYGVHPTQIHEWKRRLLDQATTVFDHGGAAKKTEDSETAELYEENGRVGRYDSVRDDENRHERFRHSNGVGIQNIATSSGTLNRNSA